MNDKKLLAPVITLLFSITMVVMSIFYNVFWFSTPYNIPLILIWSILIGDMFILPFINYNVYKVYLENTHILNDKKILMVFLFLISLLLNIITHHSWVYDQFTDVLSFQAGTMSPIGYVHFIFSTLQVFILFLIPVFWIHGIRNKKPLVTRLARKAFIGFFMFSLLGIFDMINKNVFIYKTSFLQTVYNEGFPFVTVTISIIFYMTMFYYEKNILKNT